MPKTLLKVEDLYVSYKVYKGFLKVLNGVGLTVDTGEKVGLIGESGCGKTTTMKTIMRILARNAVVERGSITYRGEDLLKVSSAQLTNLRRTSMSMIFQDPTASLNPVFKAKDQLGDIVRYSGQLGKEPKEEEIRARSVQLLKDASLPEPDRILDSYPFQLSGGMRQRLCIALSLATARDLLIADEPGTSLDVTIEDQIMKLLRNIVEERDLSVILITHSIGTVKGFVTKIYVMYAGTIIEEAPTEELFSHPLHPYTQLLFKAVPKLTGGGVPEGVAGRIPSYLDPPPGCRFVTRCPFAMPKCKERPPMFEGGSAHKVACFLYGGG